METALSSHTSTLPTGCCPSSLSLQAGGVWGSTCNPVPQALHPCVSGVHFLLTLPPR